MLSPDSYGSGKSPEWLSDREIYLQDEVELLAPVFSAAGPRLSMVGHSYGAAMALIAALQHRSRVSAMALYEPTLFSLVDARHPKPNGADGIRNAVAAAATELRQGNKDAAAGHFIDFWMGNGSWAATPAQRQLAIADSVVNVNRWSHALFREPTPVEAFAALDMPVPYIFGDCAVPARGLTRRSSRPARQAL